MIVKFQEHMFKFTYVNNSQYLVYLFVARLRSANTHLFD